MKKISKKEAKEIILKYFKKLRKVTEKKKLYEKIPLKKSSIDKALSELFKEGKLGKSRVGNNYDKLHRVIIYWGLTKSILRKKEKQ